MGEGQGRSLGRGRAGNTGTSHELNRTANSSTRAGLGRMGGVEVVGGGEQIAFTFFYATHTHTHTRKRKRDTSCIFPPKLRIERGGVTV